MILLQLPTVSHLARDLSSTLILGASQRRWLLSHLINETGPTVVNNLNSPVHMPHNLRAWWASNTLPQAYHTTYQLPHAYCHDDILRSIVPSVPTGDTPCSLQREKYKASHWPMCTLIGASQCCHASRYSNYMYVLENVLSRCHDARLIGTPGLLSHPFFL